MDLATPASLTSLLKVHGHPKTSLRREVRNLARKSPLFCSLDMQFSQIGSVSKSSVKRAIIVVLGSDSRLGFVELFLE